MNLPFLFTRLSEVTGSTFRRRKIKKKTNLLNLSFVLLEIVELFISHRWRGEK